MKAHRLLTRVWARALQVAGLAVALTLVFDWAALVALLDWLDERR